MLPNPFDLPGPEFLAFFIAFSVVVAAGMVWIRRRGEPADPSYDGRLNDPYELAYLKAGRAHLLRVAVLSLIDRRLLEPDGSELKTADPDAVRRVDRPLDRAILQRFVVASASSDLFTDANISDQAEEIGNKLRAEGLLPDNAQLVRRRNILIGGILLVLSVGIVKLFVAVSRGRTNVLFLLILCVIVPIVLTLVSNPLRTPRGSRVFARTQSLLGGLHSRRESLAMHMMNDDLTLLAAVFGLAVLPAEPAGLMRSVKLRPQQDSALIGSSCGGSSCGGSSCGGGGGCGGGGCGGGCGGCGGG